MKILIIFFLFFSLASANNDYERIKEAVIGRYEKIHAAKCVFHRHQLIGENEIESEGIYYTALPDTVLIEILSPKKMIYLLTTDSLMVYSKEEKYCEINNLEKVPKQERQVIKNLSFFKMNFFKDLEKGYEIKYSHDVGEDLIYKAIPKADHAPLSFILIKVDTAMMVYKAFEVFDKQEHLISQMKFSQFDYFEKEKLSFPIIIEQKTLSNGSLLSERFTLKRLVINPSFRHDQFKPRLPSDVEIVVY